MHNLQEDILDEFAEAQHKGTKRFNRLNFGDGFSFGWQPPPLQPKCMACGLNEGQHRQFGCRPPGGVMLLPTASRLKPPPCSICKRDQWQCKRWRCKPIEATRGAAE